MPPVAVASMAKKAGVTPAKAEEAWAKIKKAIVGKKLKSGTVVASDDEKWTGEVWGYVMGALKKALKLESTAEDLINQLVVEGSSAEQLVSSILDQVETHLDEANEGIQAAVVIKSFVNHFPKGVKRSQVADLLAKAIDEKYIKPADLRNFVKVGGILRNAYNEYSAAYDGPTF